MRRGLFSCLVLVAVCSTAAANSSPAAPAPAFAVTFVEPFVESGVDDLGPYNDWTVFSLDKQREIGRCRTHVLDSGHQRWDFDFTGVGHVTVESAATAAVKYPTNSELFPKRNNSQISASYFFGHGGITLADGELAAFVGGVVEMNGLIFKDDKGPIPGMDCVIRFVTPEAPQEPAASIGGPAFALMFSPEPLSTGSDELGFYADWPLATLDRRHPAGFVRIHFPGHMMETWEYHVMRDGVELGTISIALADMTGTQFPTNEELFGRVGPSESLVYSAFARGAITAASGEFADFVGGMVEMRGWGAASPNGDRRDVHCLCYIVSRP